MPDKKMWCRRRRCYARHEDVTPDKRMWCQTGGCDARQCMMPDKGWCQTRCDARQEDVMPDKRMWCQPWGCDARRGDVMPDNVWCQTRGDARQGVMPDKVWCQTRGCDARQEDVMPFTKMCCQTCRKWQTPRSHNRYQEEIPEIIHNGRHQEATTDRKRQRQTPTRHQEAKMDRQEAMSDTRRLRQTPGSKDRWQKTKADSRKQR